MSPIWCAADSVELAWSSIQPMVAPCYIILHITHQVMGRLVIQQTLRPASEYSGDLRSHRGRWTMAGTIHSDDVAWMELHLQPTLPWQRGENGSDSSEDDGNDERLPRDASIWWHHRDCSRHAGHGFRPAPVVEPTEARTTTIRREFTGASREWRPSADARRRAPTDTSAVPRSTSPSARSRSRQRTRESLDRSAHMLAAAFAGASFGACSSGCGTAT